MQRYYAGENIINCRDLGGYACDNGTTAFGKALRAGILRDPSEKDLAILRNFGVKTVIDLRGVEEAEDMPSFFKNNSEFDYYHITLLEANPAMAKTEMSMVELYKLCLSEYSENFAKALRTIAALDKPFMFHCFCGKDRTGMLAAFLLSAAGVCKEDIIADYEVSYTYIRPYIEREIRNNSGLIWDGAYERFYSEAENMAQILGFIDEKYGGAIGFFEKIGLTADEINALQTKLF